MQDKKTHENRALALKADKELPGGREAGPEE